MTASPRERRVYHRLDLLRIDPELSPVSRYYGGSKKRRRLLHRVAMIVIGIAAISFALTV